MSDSAKQKLVDLGPSFLFLLFSVFFLPFLDWPFIPGKSFIRPLSLYPISIGLIFLLSQFSTLKISKKHGRNFFSTFTLFTCFSFFLSMFFISIFLFDSQLAGAQSNDYELNILRGTFSLLCGWLMYFYFYFTISKFPLFLILPTLYKTILITICITFLAALVQSLTQNGFSFTESINNLFQIFHSSGQLEHNKAYGLSPEGSYLADTIAVLYLPICFSSITTNHSAFHKIPFIGRIEVFLFVPLIITLFLSQSRIGFITLVFLFICFCYINFRNTNDNKKRKIKKWRLLISTCLLVFVPLAYIFSQQLMTTLASFLVWDNSSEVSGESNVTRLSHMLTAIYIFLKYPLGVGLGGFPNYYERFIPSWALWNPEIQNYLGFDSGRSFIANPLPNPKAMFPKVLCETGIVGALIFTWFYFSLLYNVYKISKLKFALAETKYWIYIMLYSLLAMIPFSFNNDSFLIPYYYFIFVISELLLKSYAQLPLPT